MISKMSDSSRWYWLAVASIVFVLLYLLSPILTPFLMGALLGYLGDPLVDRLEKYKLSRTLSVVFVFLVISMFLLAILLLGLPVIESQLKGLIQRLPAIIDWGLKYFQPFLHKDLNVDMSVLEIDQLKKMLSSHWDEAGGILRYLFSTVSHSGLLIAAWTANLALTPVVTFYMLRDWDHFVAYINDLIPRNIEPAISQIARESDAVLSSFLRGQMLVMLALGLIYSFGLWLVGVDFSLLIGMLAGLLSFVPYLGFIIGILIAGVTIMFQTHDITDLLLVLLVFGIAQIIEGVILTPTLVGERIGLHPVAVIFAVLAGGQLFGFFGILLALPVAAVLVVILRHLHTSYKESRMYRI
jgi:predicted PurR-regulated permease PerM